MLLTFAALGFCPTTTIMPGARHWVFGLRPGGPEDPLDSFSPDHMHFMCAAANHSDGAIVGYVIFKDETSTPRTFLDADLWKQCLITPGVVVSVLKGHDCYDHRGNPPYALDARYTAMLRTLA